MDVTTRPRLVFIHGTSGYKKPKQWLEPLNRSLRELGIEPWDESSVPEVRYARLLRGQKDSARSRERHQPNASAERKAVFDANRDELSARLSNLSKRKPRLADLPGWVRRRGAKYGRALFFGDTAERYRDRRNCVCNHVRDVAGPGELILVGYSLGSVVAADLLSRLRPDQHVRLLITLGSPLGAGSWDRTWRGLQPFPYDRVDAWVNIHNRADPVTGWVGLKRRNIVDVRTGSFPNPKRNRSVRRLKKLFLAQHKVGRYTGHAAVAAAIAWALEGSAVENVVPPG